MNTDDEPTIDQDIQPIENQLQEYSFGAQHKSSSINQVTVSSNSESEKDAHYKPFVKKILTTHLYANIHKDL